MRTLWGLKERVAVGRVRGESRLAILPFLRYHAVSTIFVPQDTCHEEPRQLSL